jgi:hypothetical protein
MYSVVSLAILPSLEHWTEQVVEQEEAKMDAKEFGFIQVLATVAYFEEDWCQDSPLELGSIRLPLN